MVIYTKNTLYDWRFIMINRNSGCNNEEKRFSKKENVYGNSSKRGYYHESVGTNSTSDIDLNLILGNQTNKNTNKQ